MDKKNTQSFFQKQLHNWNATENNRQMPWKGERDPYKIWLSEVILQQTRVEQGLEYYKRFIETYPNVSSLAAADDAAVFKLWEGLGYYSRCKNLLFAARFIMSSLNGIFPTGYSAILNLKGVGTYTAAAIASFAFDLPYAVVDGNVTRVLARYFGIETPIDSSSGVKSFSTLAQTLLNRADPAFYNQGIMDFGATICKPRQPLCFTCPLQRNCEAFQKDLIDILPVKEKKIARKQRWLCYVILQYQGSFLVRKRTSKDIWQNLYEFVLIETETATPVREVLKSTEVGRLLGRSFTLQNTSPCYRQLLTHQVINGYFIYIILDDKPVSKEYHFLQASEIKHLPFPRFINTYIEATNMFS